MDQEDMIYTLKVKSIQHYYGNHGKTIDSNHGSGSHPNEDIKVFKKHRVSDHLYALSMPKNIKNNNFLSQLNSR